MKMPDATFHSFQATIPGESTARSCFPLPIRVRVGCLRQGTAILGKANASYPSVRHLASKVVPGNVRV